MPLVERGPAFSSLVNLEFELPETTAIAAAEPTVQAVAEPTDQEVSELSFYEPSESEISPNQFISSCSNENSLSISRQ